MNLLLLLILTMIENFDERLKQANLASKSGLADFIKKKYFDKNLRNIRNKKTSNKTRETTNASTISVIHYFS